MLRIKDGLIKRDRFQIRDIDLHIERNKFYAVIGKNAAGKSSLLYTLTGGIYTRLEKEEGLKIAYVGDDWPYRKGVSLFNLKEQIKLLDPDFERGKFIASLARYDIYRFNNYRALSKGQRKIVLLSIALARKPDLLILDEILLNIDQYKKEDFKSLLEDFMKNDGKSIVLATNQLDVFEDLVDDLIYIKDNQIFYSGNLGDLKRNFLVKQVSSQDVDKYTNLVNLEERAYYSEILLREENDGHSNILDIIRHLERSKYERIHL